MSQSTWSANTHNWTVTDHTWTNNTYASTATLGGNNSVATSNNVIYPVTVLMTQLNLTELNEEDAIKLASLTLGATVGTTAAANLLMPITVTLATETNLKNNVNFEESASFSLTSDSSSDNTFLWNDVAEDEDTLWTKISDPDE